MYVTVKAAVVDQLSVSRNTSSSVNGRRRVEAEARNGRKTVVLIEITEK